MLSPIHRLVILTFSTFAVLSAPTLPIIAASSHAPSYDEASWMLEQLNCLRQSVGAAPLRLNPALVTSSTQHSIYLANNEWSDVHIEADGTTPRARMLAAGYTGYTGENVVGGRSVERAFNWLVNDDIHYRNMVNIYWDEVGIGVGTGPRGTWYTMDLGTTNWKPKKIPAAACGNYGQPAPPAESAKSGEASEADAPKAGEASQAEAAKPAKPANPQPPAFVAGVDEHGNIKHRIQQGDTLGGIVAIYGYTWDDIPSVLSLNNLSQPDFRLLKIGDILLIPPKKGTYTPAPGQAQPTDAPTNATTNTATHTAAATDTPAATIVPTETLTPTPSPSPTLPIINKGNAVLLIVTATPRPTNDPAAVALAATNAVLVPPQAQTPQDSPIRGILPWALVLQGVVVGGLIVGSIVRRKVRR